MEKEQLDLKEIPEFKMLYPPLRESDQKDLENSIHYFGYNSEIQIWNNMLLDSFDAYRFCVKYSKPFFVKRKAFRSYEDAICVLFILMKCKII